MTDLDPTESHKLDPDAAHKLPARVSDEDLALLPEAVQPFFSKLNGSNYLQTDTLPPALNALQESKSRHKTQIDAKDAELSEMQAKIAAFESAPKPKAAPAKAGEEAPASQLASLQATIDEQLQRIAELEPKITAYETEAKAKTHRQMLADRFKADGAPALNGDGMELALDVAVKHSKISEDGKGLEFLSPTDGAVRLADDGSSPMSAAAWLNEATKERKHWLETAPKGSGSHLANRGRGSSQKRIKDMTPAEKSKERQRDPSGFDKRLRAEIAADTAALTKKPSAHHAAAGAPS